MNVTKRKLFTESFKEDAIKLAESVGSTKAAKDLGINPANIRRWKAELNPKQPQSQEQLEAENSRLKKELQYVLKINEVLKKSLGIFATEKSKNLI